MTCSHCGQVNPADARFCVGCGAPLATRGEPSAYRPVDREDHDLQPRNLDQLISGTIAVYRSDPRSFWVLAIVPQIPALISIFTPVVIAWLFVLVGFVAYLVAFTATVHATGQRTLGQSIDVGRSLSLAWSRIVPLILAALMVVLALGGSAILAVILVGIPLCFYLLVNWFFIVPAIMVENTAPRAALSRSSSLVRDWWWQTFGNGIVFVILIVLMTIVVNIPSILLLSIANSSAGSIAASIASIVIFPVIPIAATLVYLDLRVRKDDYTLGDLALEIGRRNPWSDT